MRLLFVFSGNSSADNFSIEKDQAFIFDLINSLRNFDIEIESFIIKGTGFHGYFRNLLAYRKVIKHGKFDVVHAIYGLSGLLAVLQRSTPVVITFIGTDITDIKSRLLSWLSMILSAFNIFVSDHLATIARAHKRYTVIPFGVDMTGTFYPLDKQECRRKLNLHQGKKLVLFSSSFNREIKNYPLAKKATDLIGGIDLLEMMKGHSRKDVNVLINASDVVLLTSFSEGSPQIINEAMACNCPVVTTDVGDARAVIGATEGCFITTFEADDVAFKISEALKFGRRTNGRENIKEYSSTNIADKVFCVYQKVQKRKK